MLKNVSEESLLAFAPSNSANITQSDYVGTAISLFIKTGLSSFFFHSPLVFQLLVRFFRMVTCDSPMQNYYIEKARRFQFPNIQQTEGRGVLPGLCMSPLLLAAPCGDSC